MGAVIEARVRAAGAIHDYDGVEIARAALQAIREPSSEMSAGVFYFATSTQKASEHEERFTAMIDAILNEKP
jgi:hypothetical protein